MRKTKAKILFLWAFFALCIRFNVEAKPSSTLETEIEAKLRQLNKPAVKTIKVCISNILSFFFQILTFLNALKFFIFIKPNHQCFQKPKFLILKRKYIKQNFLNFVGYVVKKTFYHNKCRGKYERVDYFIINFISEII